MVVHQHGSDQYYGLKVSAISGDGAAFLSDSHDSLCFTD
jgi:hypothetical protein